MRTKPARKSASGHSRPGRASSKSSDVGYAADSRSNKRAVGREPLRRGPRRTTAFVANGGACRAGRATPIEVAQLRLPMPIVRILLVLVALASPALAQDGARDAAAAREATRAFRVYVEGVMKKNGRPDLTRPEVAALLDRVFDLGALNALPPAQASDISWLLDWMDAANATVKLFTRYGSIEGPQPDLVAIQRNMTAYEDQYAAAMNFMIRGFAREAVSSKLFMAGLPPEQRTRVREEGLAGARSSTAEFILDAICLAVQSGAKPANARLVAAAIRDTREVWASYFLPQDRARTIELLADLPTRVPDETARTDLAAFTAALQAVN
jgi:hypothetical protein